MSIEGETEYKAKVRLEARLGEHLNFSPGGLAQNCQHVAGFEHKRHRKNSCNFTHFHSHFKFRIGETLVLTLSTKAARINYSELYFSLVPVLSLFGKKANSLIILSG